MNLNQIRNLNPTILEELEAMNEGILDMPEGTDLEQQLQILSDKMILAKKMLSLANKLKDPISKKKHRGRVMGILNKVRAALKAATAKLAAEDGSNIQ